MAATQRIGFIVFAAGAVVTLWLANQSFDVNVGSPEESFTAGVKSRPQSTGLNHRPSAPPPSSPIRVPVVDQAYRASTKAAFEKLRRGFFQDPSFSARCLAGVVPIDSVECIGPGFTTTATKPVLMLPESHGETTKGMKVQTADARLGSSATGYHRVNGSIVHHEIFFAFAERTFHDAFLPNRITEFNGVHTNVTYDCTGNIDFRLYHQIRAAMCEQHERDAARSAADAVGYFPLVDEEYFEYIATLSLARHAALDKRPFTFIELGARYGTWIVRAGASYRLFDGEVSKLALLAVEGSCEWYRRMEEHVKCNHLNNVTELILAYAAPKSFNSIDIEQPSTFTKARAVSLLDILPSYDHIDMIDFDIQKFEAMAVEEAGVMALMNTRVGFVHFGTHSTDIESRLARIFAANGWVVVYFFAGAHTKKLDRGHRCTTPFGPSGFNDGAVGFANPAFHPGFKHLAGKFIAPKRMATACYWAPESLRTESWRHV